MATWGQVEKELLANRDAKGHPDFDGVRRRYLKELAEYTGRNCIVYETAGFAPPPGATPDATQISLDPDIGAFMEVVHGLDRDAGLDLILHSPGGTAEAAEAIIEYIRPRFTGLRVIVPVAAMSAATMMAMAADEIVLGDHSQLGPIDPQLTIATPEGPRSAPAAAIKQQFVDATLDLKEHPDHLTAWLPIIRGMSPALLQICNDSEDLSKAMVTTWLERYMFSGRDDKVAAAKDVAEKLSEYKTYMSHQRRLGKQDLRDLGLKVVDLEADQNLQDLVLSVHHAINHVMAMRGVTKIVENHLGKAFVRAAVAAVPVSAERAAQAAGGQAPAPNRQQRRAQERAQRKKGGR